MAAPEFNVRRCPSCGFSERLDIPFILWEAHFIAVVLGQRFKIEKAIGVIKTLLVGTKPARNELPEHVVVFGIFEQLAKALMNPALTRKRVSIWNLLYPKWSGVKHVLEDAAEALIQRNMPERAFKLYAEVIDHLPVLYAADDVREKFLMCAHLAGSRVPPEQEDDRTALEQAKEYEEKLGSLADNQAEFLAPYQVYYCPIDEDPDIEKEFLEGDQHVTSMVIEHIELPSMDNYETAQECLLVRCLLSNAENWLGKPEPRLERWRVLTQIRLDATWYGLLSSSQKDELRQWYRSFAGGNLIEIE